MTMSGPPLGANDEAVAADAAERDGGDAEVARDGQGLVEPLGIDADNDPVLGFLRTGGQQASAPAKIRL